MDGCLTWQDRTDEHVRISGGPGAAQPGRTSLQVTSHPFLCDGVEEDFMAKRGAAKDDELQRLIASSGKMLLLAKLLPKLRAEGHKVPMVCRSWC